MCSLPFDRYGAPRHALAAAAAVIALGVGVALIASSGATAPRVEVARGAPAADRAGPRFPHTRAGAVEAATAWCQETGEAFVSGTWSSAVKALAAPSLIARADLMAPASAFTHRSLVAHHLTSALRIWPLGYAIDQYSSSTARVRVWQLVQFATTAPNELAAYPITNVSLAWIEGDWKITGAPPDPDLTPPGPASSASQATSWITAVNELQSYSYAP
jgi:hypothetical protein